MNSSEKFKIFLNERLAMSNNLPAQAAYEIVKKNFDILFEGELMENDGVLFEIIQLYNKYIKPKSEKYPFGFENHPSLIEGLREILKKHNLVQ